jgi:hypothetical protein
MTTSLRAEPLIHHGDKEIAEIKKFLPSLRDLRVSVVKN